MSKLRWEGYFKNRFQYNQEYVFGIKDWIIYIFFILIALIVVLALFFLNCFRWTI